MTRSRKYLLIGVCSAVFGSAAIQDVNADGFSTTGAMNTFRSAHTATVLTNNTVLVAGGDDATNTVRSSAEIYYPDTGGWTNTGSMSDGRAYHTAVLLSDGKVLVAGGIVGSSGTRTSAEIYNPATGTWTNAGNMATGRHSHTATLLTNGQVLIAGGQPSGGGYLASVELYDPTSGTWTNVSSMPVSRFLHTATRLSDGRVLVAGGFGSTGKVLYNAELYDPVAKTWTTVVDGGLLAGRYGHNAILLPDSRVLFVGGVSGGGALDSVELFDITLGSDQWTGAASLNHARGYSGASLLPNGRVLVVGGVGGGGGALASTELYDIATDSWSLTGSLIAGRFSPPTVLMAKGKVLSSGSIGTNGNVLSSAEIYSWSSYVDMLARMEAGTNSSFVTTNILNSATSGSGGVWRMSNEDPYNSTYGVPLTQFKISTNQEATISGISVSGSGSGDSGSTRSLKMNMAADNEFARYKFTTSRSKVSVGFAVRAFSESTYNWYNHFGMEGSSDTDYDYLTLSHDDSPGTNNVWRISTSAGLGSNVSVSGNTWYWVTILWDKANLTATIKIYNTSTWALVGTSSKAIDSVNCTAIFVGRWDDGNSYGTADVYYDDLCIDLTGSQFPLLPSEAR